MKHTHLGCMSPLHESYLVAYMACPPSSRHTRSLFLCLRLVQGSPCDGSAHICWKSISALLEEGNNGDSPSAVLDAAMALNTVATLDAVAMEIQVEADGEIY